MTVFESIINENLDSDTLATEGKLILIVGKNGSGKTLLLTYINYKSKKPVLSNFAIKDKKYKPLTLKVLLDLPDSHNVYIDEMYTWLESRVSNNALNRYLSTIIFQKRKRDLDIYGTVQMLRSVDVRVRHQIDILVFAETRENKKDDFHYDVIDINENSIATIDITYQQAVKLFNMYDTNEIIPVHNLKQLEFKIIEQNPEQLLEKVKEISELIEPFLNETTHDTIKSALLFNNIAIGYEKYVYMYLTKKINYDTINKNKQKIKCKKT